jgi:hypothetical protein
MSCSLKEGIFQVFHFMHFILCFHFMRVIINNKCIMFHTFFICIDSMMQKKILPCLFFANNIKFITFRYIYFHFGCIGHFKRIGYSGCINYFGLIDRLLKDIWQRTKRPTACNIWHQAKRALACAHWHVGTTRIWSRRAPRF